MDRAALIFTAVFLFLPILGLVLTVAVPSLGLGLAGLSLLLLAVGFFVGLGFLDV